MGTRADFYEGVGPKAKWLGSVAFDGYEWHETPDCALMQSQTASAFAEQVGKIAEDRDDFTKPENGWPWPWGTSATTDYAYCFVEGEVQVYTFGKLAETDIARSDWPDMSAVQNVQIGGIRSGVIVAQGGRVL